MRKTAVLILLAVLALGSCATLDFTPEKTAAAFPAYPPVRFAVFSDAHVFLPELGIGQPSFEKVKFEDRKMFEHSQSLLETVLAKIREANPQFVLVPGDLSKDGEEAVHLAVATALESLRSAGIPVYVIPGNHDVNNPRAFRYEGDRRVRIPNVTPDRFAEIYRDFGYGEAVERDPTSLAYVVEPVPGLWVLAMDSCRYDLSFTEKSEHTGGALTRERLSWIREVLQRARWEHKAVVAMVHHGVVEHFPGQKSQFSDYVIRDDEAFSRMLAEYGVRVVFTGHFHAQNIAGRWWDSSGEQAKPPARRFLYDIETGSLVTFPSPWRMVQIGSDQVMQVRSFRIEAIPEMPTGFQEYAAEYSRQGMFFYIEGVMKGYGVSKEEADRVAGPITDAALAHFGGDPVFQGTEMYPTKGLSPMAWIAIQAKKGVIEGMWKGVPPHADNNIDIDLNDGTWRRID